MSWFKSQTTTTCAFVGFNLLHPPGPTQPRDFFSAHAQHQGWSQLTERHQSCGAPGNAARHARPYHARHQLYLRCKDMYIIIYISCLYIYTYIYILDVCMKINFLNISYIHICMCVHMLSSDYLRCRCPFKYVYVSSGSTMVWHGSCTWYGMLRYMSICVMFIVNINVHVMFMLIFM